ncbi:MAG: helix-turn-helix domain-containing protein [Thermoleophilia bacterium]|jgi:AcrR family transcriptional regulator|nr:helix-turn-helix domain-containing protein [Thermoleophilia bacterium]
MKAGGAEKTPRRTDTRRVLIDAAARVFLERGFARATTKEIAQAAGVAEGTIYRHFDDKHALFHEVFLAVAGDTVEELAHFPERAGRGTVRENLERLLQLLSGMIEHTTSLTASIWADPEMARRFEAYIRERMPMGLQGGPVAVVAAYLRAEQGLGRVRGDVDALEAAAVVVSVPFANGMQRAMQERLPGPGDFPSPGAAAPEILARGLEPGAGTSGYDV